MTSGELPTVTDGYDILVDADAVAALPVPPAAPDPRTAVLYDEDGFARIVPGSLSVRRATAR